jgi:hypothetical protein
MRRPTRISPLAWWEFGEALSPQLGRVVAVVWVGHRVVMSELPIKVTRPKELRDDP